MTIAVQGGQDAVDARRQPGPAAEPAGQLAAFDGAGLASEGRLKDEGLFVAIGREGGAAGRAFGRREQAFFLGLDRGRGAGAPALEFGTQPAHLTARFLDVAHAVQPGQGGDDLGLGLFGRPTVGLGCQAIDI